MKQIAIDPEERVARAQTGLTWAEYAGHAAQYGLATSSGDMGTVGLGGLTLGGGIGWMVRKHGLTIDHLISAEVVTADGSILRASEDENQDLFWAIRGGGGNFGIVTELELRLQPAPLVVGGGVFYSADEAHEVLRAYTEYASSAPDELTTMASLMAAPPAPFIPVEHQGKPALLILVCYTGDIDEGMKVVAPLRQLGAAIADVVSPMPYPVMFELSKEGGVKGNHHAVRSMFMQDVDDESIDTIVCRYAQATSPHAMVQLRPLGGAMSRVPEDATAFAHRDARYLINLVSSWVEPVGAGQHVEWLRDFWNAIRSKTSGVYVNFLEDEGEARIRDAYKPHTYRRLADIKNRYDPENVFHLNQNIRPKV